MFTPLAMNIFTCMFTMNFIVKIFTGQEAMNTFYKLFTAMMPNSTTVQLHMLKYRQI